MTPLCVGGCAFLPVALEAAAAGARDHAPSSDERGGVVGYEFPLAERLQLTLETYGEEHSPLDKAPGLRYEIADGLRSSAALGRSNGRAFHQLDLAWEF